MQKLESKWVYSMKTDLLLFIIPNLLAALTAYPTQFGLGEFISIYIVVDQSHVYTTFFFTYNSKRFSKRYKKQLTIIPILSLIISSGLVLIWGFKPLIYLLTTYSMFHFAKQQMSWFYIASAKENSHIFKLEKYIDKLTINLSVLGPGLISLTYIAGRNGWRGVGDMPTLPEETILIVFAMWCLSFGSYVLVQILKYIRLGLISWGKNFHLLNGLMIWCLFRFLPLEKLFYLGGYLVIFGHSIPYIYLGQRYVKNRIKMNEEFYILFPSKIFVVLILFSLGMMFSYFEVTGFDILRSDRTLFSIFRVLVISMVFTHYTIDGFMWKRKVHPEGLSFLK